MKKEFKDLVQEGLDGVKTAGKAAAETLKDSEKRDAATGSARKAVHEVADSVADLVDAVTDGTRSVLQSEEVEGAIDGFGTLLKGWAEKIRESRDTNHATATDTPDSQDISDETHIHEE